MGDIRNAQLDLLTNTNQEFIEFKRYDKDGVFQETLVENVLLTAPDVIIPLYNDMTVEYLKPIKRVTTNTKTPKRNVVNNDPMFNYNGYRFNVETSVVSTNQAIISLGGKARSLTGDRFLLNTQKDTITTSTPTSTELNALSRAWSTDEDHCIVVNTNEVEVGFSYYVENTNTSHNYFIAIQVTNVQNETGKVAGFRQWDFENNVWHFTPTSSGGFQTDAEYFLLIRNNVYNKWQNWSMKFPPLLHPTNKVQVIAREIAYDDSAGTTDHDYLYFDNVFVANYLDVSNDIFFENTRSGSDTITGSIETKDVILSNELGTTVSDKGVLDEYVTLKNGTTTTATLENIITKEKLNDFRDYGKRFEGTFFNTNSEPIPISLHNKLWMNFRKNQEPVSAMIDNMTYSVKKNEYNIVCHLPNQDDDVASDVRINFD